MVLRLLDFETTGFEPPEAQVCEAAYIDVVETPAGGWLVGTGPWGRLYGVAAMPPEVRAVHHITMGELVGLDVFGEGDVATICGGADVLVAHSAAFEQKFLGPVDRPWICTLKSALRVWPEAPSHSNSVLRYWLEDQGLLSLDHNRAMPPHRAGPDAYVTAHILLALLKLATVEEMCAWTLEPRLLPRCTIGKFRGKPWAEVEWGFLNWMLKQQDMEADLKWNAKRELDRREEESRGLPF